MPKIKVSGFYPAMIVALALGLAKPAQADTITVFTNLGLGGSFNTLQGWDVDGGITGAQAIADAFTPSLTTMLSSAELALGLNLGSGSVNVYIESDSAGLPGVIIATLIQQGSLGGFPPGALVDFTCTACPLLEAGVQYWLVAQVSDPSTAIEWNWNSTGDTSAANFAFNNSASPEGPWTIASGDTRSAFDIQGAGTPEPASFLLFGAGLVALAGVVWHKKLQRLL
ncbi:MAG TPA: choice-of-anchor R domain-containing protein [Terriglobia bacterium]|nr:choice-of-anchor R domain-containing protein [Terriglobia bacterium]